MSERERFEAPDPVQNVVNLLMIDGTVNNAFNAVLQSTSPDETWVHLSALVRSAIARAHQYHDAVNITSVARSGQAASGSSQGARSDEAVKRFGIKPWSTLAQLKDDEDLELYVRARIEAEGVGVGQPEAPTTAAPDTMGAAMEWAKRRAIACRQGTNTAQRPWLESDVQDAFCAGANFAHPHARSGAGSEEGGQG